MVKRALIVFVICFCGYSIFLKFNKNEWDTAQYQYQNNIIKADRYIYRNQTPGGVIIGSSLSAMITQDSLPEIYNLAMAGMTQFDGCHIILKRKKLPARLFIETNFFYKHETEDFTRAFDSETGLFLRDNFPALRDENQPIGILKHFLNERDKSQSGKNTIAQAGIDPKVFEEIMVYSKKFYQNVDTNAINNAIVKLRKNINAIQANGVKVYFFEMPVNSRLKNLPLAVLVKAAIKKSFPKIPYIPPPQGDYHTSDGVHLLKEEAAAYTHYFKIYAERLKQEGVPPK